ncbi:hypothetical protein E1N52_19585 [Paraburkholderia guartelaensis]|uniref:Metal ABC transporter ATPase n=2 Tax=Paraburkholderia guartelaensis TaxID=2546446 RepID=A0A4V2ZVV2_9BURK|nr:hypothetical protein [Paraburkholderia guartelaensis]TDG06535.1 hypothetical protein E1N52_19585 [Paraburkholderia guartelaensis]
MGLGMQIVYLGFAGSSALDAEAGVQLLRLDRFSGMLSGCHLAVEQLGTTSGRKFAYDVRLELLSVSREFKPIAHGENEDPIAAMRAVFDAAVHELRSAPIAGAAGHGAVRLRN